MCPICCKVRRMMVLRSQVLCFALPGPIFLLLPHSNFRSHFFLFTFFPPYLFLLTSLLAELFNYFLSLPHPCFAYFISISDRSQISTSHHIFLLQDILLITGSVLIFGSQVTPLQVFGAFMKAFSLLFCSLVPYI
jgi:hypothetical protein